MTRLAICGDAFERRHAKPLHQSIETRKHGTLSDEPGKGAARSILQRGVSGLLSEAAPNACAPAMRPILHQASRHTC